MFVIVKQWITWRWFDYPQVFAVKGNDTNWKIVEFLQNFAHFIHFSSIGWVIYSFLGSNILLSVFSMIPLSIEKPIRWLKSRWIIVFYVTKHLNNG